MVWLPAITAKIVGETASVVGCGEGVRELVSVPCGISIVVAV